MKAFSSSISARSAARIVVVAIGAHAVERAVEHADDLRRLVRHDRSLVLVPQDRNRRAARVLRIGERVQLVEAFDAVHGVGNRLGARRERPAFGSHVAVDGRDADQRFEPFELANDQRAMRPRARERDVEVIAVRLRAEAAAARRAGRAVGRYPIAKLTLRCGRSGPSTPSCRTKRRAIRRRRADPCVYLRVRSRMIPLPHL